MPRFNLICNGMMMFREVDATHVQIVIPDIQAHVRKYCTDTKPAKSNLKDLPIGKYQLQGVPAVAGSLRKLINPDEYLVLKKATVEFDEAAAGPISAVLTVPKPGSVRLFRASEPTASVFGGTSVSTAFAKPHTHHDVVVFCYKNIPAGTVRLQTDAGAVLASATPGADDIVSWVLYSTEEDPMAGGDPPHPTTLNNLLQVGGVHTDFSLSAIGFKDGLHSTGIGVSSHHMAAFHELPPTPLGSVVDLNSGDFGCSGVILAD
jgi:hypothetical protein